MRAAEIMEAFEAEYGRPLAVPDTFTRLGSVAEFFQGRDIDGPAVYSTSTYIERGREGITMDAMGVLCPFACV